MECQIVSNRKLDQMRAKKLPESKGKHSRKPPEPGDKEIQLLSVQPPFKAPKSTRDIESPTDEDRVSLDIKRVGEGNECHEKFNHFTMSRPGQVKALALSNGVPNREQPETRGKAQPPSHGHVRLGKEESITKNRTRGTDGKSGESNSSRTASRPSLTSGVVKVVCADEQISSNRAEMSGMSSIPKVSSDSPSAGSRSPGHTRFLAPPTHSSRRRASGPDQPRPSQQAKDSARRKSMHDGRGSSPWHPFDSRPGSSENGEKSRRNVISPNTLSRLGYNNDRSSERGGSASLSLCTEDDWRTYGSNFPSRKLVSHKQLNHGCSLPYSDNIGLEETVTPDQAKNASKANTPTLLKKATSKQTPKQVWHRTVRSILAANYLYHQVQKKTGHA